VLSEFKNTCAVKLKFGVKIPLRDGVKLNATLYLPVDQEVARPTIFSLTPYISDNYNPEAHSFAENGYPFLAIDVRGRGNSEGEFLPFFAEAHDGHDIVEWIAQQPYCNGKVATLGHSFGGYNQWTIVTDLPPHLATIVPSAPCFAGFDFPMRHNVYFSFLANWLTLTWGNALQGATTGDGSYWVKEYLRFYEAGLPYKEMDKFFGMDLPIFQGWVAHPRQDEYWDRGNPSPAQFAELTMPILSITGAYDGDQAGTLEFYRQHTLYAGDKARHYLVIGPWDHPGVRNPQATVLGLTCPASVIDVRKLHRDWYAWSMEDGPKPEFLRSKVAYYVLGAEKWRYADTLESVTARTEMLFLQSSFNPTDVFHSGTLALASPEASEPDSYVYDPRDLSVLRREAALSPGSLTDQRAIFTESDNHLIYHSAPFEIDTEVSGFFKLTVWISIDQPDTDFSVAVFDISDDGSSLFLTSQFLRARYRESLREEQLIETTDPLCYVFDKFQFVSRRIRKGHRLRLVFGPNHTVHWQKNYNSGKPNADESMQDARTVTVKIFHDADHPTSLSVPIAHPED
jgi:putative CocE/NonD family hydrolase